MEFLFEFLFSLIVEGSMEAAGSRRVPLPIRIIASILVVGVCGAGVFFIVLAGVASLRVVGIVPAILCFVLAAALAVGLIWKAVKFLHNRAD